MSKFAMRRRKGGFTLIEIMIVVLIIGILLAIAIPNFMKARDASRAKSCIANLKQIDTAKQQWAMDFKKVNADTPTMANLTAEGADSGRYMKAEPTCPSAGAYTVGDMVTDPICDAADTAYPHSLAEVGG